MVTTRSTNAFFSARRCRDGRRGHAAGRRRSPPRRGASRQVGTGPRRWGPGIRRSSSLRIVGRGAGRITGPDPPSRAPSATAATRPWYLLPPRSKTTASMPAALARSATQLADLAGLGGLVAVERTQVGLQGGGGGQRSGRWCRRRPGRTCGGGPGHDQTGTQQPCRRSSCGGEGGGGCARPHLPLSRLMIIAMVTYQPFRPCGGCARRRTARPCPCTGRACAACECWRQPRRPAACRCPAPRSLVGALDGEGDALRRLDRDRVAVAQRELEVRTLGHHAVTGADDLKLLLVALGDALDHVGDQRAGQAVQRARCALVVRAGRPRGCPPRHCATAIGSATVCSACPWDP